MTAFLVFLLTVAVVLCVWFFYKNKAKATTRVLDVETCTLLDKEQMVLHYGKDFKWYETSVTTKNCFNEDGDGIESIENVFQVLIEGDPLVIVFTHTELEDKVQEIHSFWVEDFPMAGVDVTYEQALEIINKVNLPKPHSRHCVLRKQVGPKEANPQYIFGNQTMQLYVDAITGKVTDKNPVFGEK